MAKSFPFAVFVKRVTNDGETMLVVWDNEKELRESSDAEHGDLIGVYELARVEQLKISKTFEPYTYPKPKRKTVRRKPVKRRKGKRG